MLSPSAPATAQVDLGEYTVFDTRFGQMQVIGGDIDQRLWFDGSFLDLPIAERYWIRGAFGMEGEAYDWVIASSNHTGNMCGGYSEWFLIRASAEEVRVAPPLNACVGILDVRVLPGQLEVDMGHRDVSISHETFTWDGVTLTSTLVPEAAAAPAGAGPDVTRWIGRTGWELLDDPSERARLGSVMAPDRVQMLSQVMSLGSVGAERNGWVIMSGCQRHQCNFAQGVLAIRISDGAVAAAILTGELPHIERFGLTSDPVISATIDQVRQ
ncbi:hypothetical protein V8J82_04310 [Gymnodinialimonas sp. 2305UL16-5]|uniref:hypothetical protein n=1 Tax=Gymnodinialimonas mytili TaxID=3126503 RepID=UPI0030A9130D